MIGSVTTGNLPENSTSFYGIYKAAVAGTTAISNNTLGSLVTANSINALSASTGIRSAQRLYGIYNEGTGTITVSGNTISNITNGTTNPNPGTPGLVNGITSISGTCAINDNSIHDLTISCTNNVANNRASSTGIALTGSTLKTVTGNVIYYLSNSCNNYTGFVIGIYFTGNT
jgi:hypothetical protein